MCGKDRSDPESVATPRMPLGQKNTQKFRRTGPSQLGRSLWKDWGELCASCHKAQCVCVCPCGQDHCLPPCPSQCPLRVPAHCRRCQVGSVRVRDPGIPSSCTLSSPCPWDWLSRLDSLQTRMRRIEAGFLTSLCARHAHLSSISTPKRKKKINIQSFMQ